MSGMEPVASSMQGLVSTATYGKEGDLEHREEVGLGQSVTFRTSIKTAIANRKSATLLLNQVMLRNVELCSMYWELAVLYHTV